VHQQLIRNNRRLALLDTVNKEEVELLGDRYVTCGRRVLCGAALEELTASFCVRARRWASAECMQAVMNFMSRRQKASL
jgi:hypothetical protein